VKLSSANVLGLGQMKSILFPQFKSNPLTGWRGVVLNNSPTSNDSFDGQNLEPEAIYQIKSTNIPLTNIPYSRWVSSLNPTYEIGDRTEYYKFQDVTSVLEDLCSMQPKVLAGEELSLCKESFSSFSTTREL
jgi:hypothetical protein